MAMPHCAACPSLVTASDDRSPEEGAPDACVRSGNQVADAGTPSETGDCLATEDVASGPFAATGPDPP
eukprot:14709863-Alexandrium_andersonii.AAC.1